MKRRRERGDLTSHRGKSCCALEERSDKESPIGSAPTGQSVERFAGSASHCAAYNPLGLVKSMRHLIKFLPCFLGQCEGEPVVLGHPSGSKAVLLSFVSCFHAPFLHAPSLLLSSPSCYPLSSPRTRFS